MISLKNKVVPNDVYNTILETTDYKTITELLSLLPNRTKGQALKSSLLKWKILAANKNLSKSGIGKIGRSIATCGLCTHFENDCELCCEFTGLIMFPGCFKQYVIWLGIVKSSIDVKPATIRNKAQVVHDLLYLCYEREVLKNTKKKEIQEVNCIEKTKPGEVAWPLR